MAERKCKFCEFYDIDVNGGHCRRNPPQVAIVPLGKGGHGGKWASQFPLVSANAWCGEFIAAQQPDVVSPPPI